MKLKQSPHEPTNSGNILIWEHHFPSMFGGHTGSKWLGRTGQYWFWAYTLARGCARSCPSMEDCGLTLGTAKLWVEKFLPSITAPRYLSPQSKLLPDERAPTIVLPIAMVASRYNSCPPPLGSRPRALPKHHLPQERLFQLGWSLLQVLGESCQRKLFLEGKDKVQSYV